MESDGSGYSKTGLVAEIRKNNLFWQEGEVTVYLAESMGYCWGVERAVQMAYEARKSHPASKLHLTNEIIHNPQINTVNTHCKVDPGLRCVAEDERHGV